MTDTWAAKVLAGVPRFDFDTVDGLSVHLAGGEWVRFDDALAAIASMGAGDGELQFPDGWRERAHSFKGILKLQAAWADGFKAARDLSAAHIAALKAQVAEMRASISWVDEVYPERIEAGGAGLQITWQEFNAMQAAIGVTVDKRIGGAEGKAVHNHRLRAKLKAAEAERVAAYEKTRAEAAEARISELVEECNQLEVMARDYAEEAAALRERVARLEGALKGARWRMKQYNYQAMQPELAEIDAALTDGGKDG